MELITIIWELIYYVHGAEGYQEDSPRGVAGVNSGWVGSPVLTDCQNC